MTGLPDPATVATSVAAMVAECDALVFVPQARLPIGKDGGGANAAFPSAPIFLLPLIGLGADAVAVAVAETATLQVVTDGIRVLVWADGDPFELIRPYGWPVEHVMRESDWLRLGQERDWLTHCRDSLRWIVTTYGVAEVLTVDDAGHLTAVPSRVEVDLDELRGIAGTRDVTSPRERDFTSWRAWLASGARESEGSARVGTSHAATVTHELRTPAALLVRLDLADGTGGPGGLDHVARHDAWSTVRVRASSAADGREAVAFAAGLLPMAAVSVLLLGAGVPRTVANGLTQYDFHARELADGTLEVEAIFETRGDRVAVDITPDEALAAFTTYWRHRVAIENGGML